MGHHWNGILPGHSPTQLSLGSSCLSGDEGGMWGQKGQPLGTHIAQESSLWPSLMYMGWESLIAYHLCLGTNPTPSSLICWWAMADNLWPYGPLLEQHIVRAWPGAQHSLSSSHSARARRGEGQPLKFPLMHLCPLTIGIPSLPLHLTLTHSLSHFNYFHNSEVAKMNNRGGFEEICSPLASFELALSLLGQTFPFLSSYNSIFYFHKLL